MIIASDWSNALQRRPTPFGLPRGSVLGPLLYILFTADIGPLGTLTKCPRTKCLGQNVPGQKVPG